MGPINLKKASINKPRGKNKNRKRKQKNLPSVAESLKKGAKAVKKHKWSDARELKLKNKNANKEETKAEEDVTGKGDGPSKSGQKAKGTAKGPRPSTSSLTSFSKNKTGLTADKRKKGNNLKAKAASALAEPKESLKDRMVKRLQAARFRQINEELDNNDNTPDSNPAEAFESNPELFQKYHEAYKGRMEHWPKNPLDVIVKWINRKVSKDRIIADFGCGEAKLSLAVPNKVHSFDLFALNDRVTACDMSKVPLEDESVDVAVFCLSLMGTDVCKFIAEANRVLKMNGILKIAEVSSRFSGNTFTAFLKRMKKFGFVARQKGQKSHDSEDDDVFLVFEFLKIRTLNNTLGSLPSLRLSPSVYKKR